MARVVNLRKPGRGTVVKVDRTTIFGNPVVLGKRCPECGDTHQRDPQMKALVCYGRYLIRRISSDDGFAQQVRQLAFEKRIGCWCAPMPCHADMLALYANECATGGRVDRGLRALSEYVDRLHDNATRQTELFV